MNLLASLRRNVLPEEYEVTYILKSTGWSYRELLDTPFGLVERFMELHGAMNKLEAEAAKKRR